VQWDQACSAHRCTQSADNGRRSPEQCSIQATSQCRDQRNNERSHCGLWADARLGRVAAPVAAPLLSGRQKPNFEAKRISDRSLASRRANLAPAWTRTRMLRKIKKTPVIDRLCHSRIASPGANWDPTVESRYSQPMTRVLY
jgi:hypothetical protein